MKKAVLFSLFLLGVVDSHTYVVNHASKVYGMIGAGTQLFMGGVGGSYAGEMKMKSGDFIMHVTTVDFQMMGILSPSAFEFNLAGTYGIGFHFPKGNKMVLDILGIGLNIRSSGYGRNGSSVIYAAPSAFMLTLPGFQGTLTNGLYVAWRNNYSIGNFSEFKSYIAIGFDFSKLYNKKAFEVQEYF